MPQHDDSIDAAVRHRSQSTGQPAIDALNKSVAQADPTRRDALERRLLAQLQDGKRPERKSIMDYSSPLRTSLRPQLSLNLLLTVAVAALCVAVVLFARFNPQPPEEQALPVAAPVHEDQSQSAASPTPFTTGTPLGADTTSDLHPTSQVIDPAVVTATPFSVEMASSTPVPSATATPFAAELASSTPAPFATGTPLPFGVNYYMPYYAPYSTDHVEPPSVWFPGDAHISAPNASGLMVGLPAGSLVPTSGMPPIEVGDRVSLLTTIAIPAEDGPRGAVQFDQTKPSETVVVLAPVAAAAEVMSVGENGNVIVWVTLEQGVVLNWLLNDARALIYYGYADE